MKRVMPSLDLSDIIQNFIDSLMSPRSTKQRHTPDTMTERRSVTESTRPAAQNVSNPKKSKTKSRSRKSRRK